ncbi:hypothetical protein [Sulfurimonas aquatica]|uniref:hypothetical protein n=1 Tax=Sulfurimonas aquatica TaxID=2672570 RepID=UPI001F611202|nr:hypothetical protein [Sulfurimonas aquatica]
MKVKLFISLLLLLLGTSFLNADTQTRFENSNFTLSDTQEHYNYNRSRLRVDYQQENYFATLIGDVLNYYGIDSPLIAVADTPLAIKSRQKEYENGSLYAKVHRLYGGYEDEDNRIVLGLQNITMGVGRLWNPTNIFNPRYTYALEPDETLPVLALSYTRHLSSTSDISLIASQKNDLTYKYALRYKSFTEYGDIAFNTILSEQTTMLGYELESNLADTGIEVRSEGAYVNAKIKQISSSEERELYQAILGADYGFVNGLNLTLEALYSSNAFNQREILLNSDSEIFSNLSDSQLYVGGVLSYPLNIFLNLSVSYIESFITHKSHFVSPNVTYTLNDFNSFSLGALIQDGDAKNILYFNYTLSF